MELSKEEEYERIQNLYVRPYQTYHTFYNVNCSVPTNSPTIQSHLDTIATIKNEVVVPPQIEVENLKEKIEATILCDTCGGRYSHFNKNRHNATKKHQSAINPLSFPPSPLLVREKVVEGSSP